MSLRTDDASLSFWLAVNGDRMPALESQFHITVLGKSLSQSRRMFHKARFCLQALLGLRGVDRETLSKALPRVRRVAGLSDEGDGDFVCGLTGDRRQGCG